MQRLFLLLIVTLSVPTWALDISKYTAVACEFRDGSVLESPLEFDQDAEVWDWEKSKVAYQTAQLPDGSSARLNARVDVKGDHYIGLEVAGEWIELEFTSEDIRSINLAGSGRVSAVCHWATADFQFPVGHARANAAAVKAAEAKFKHNICVSKSSHPRSLVRYASDRFKLGYVVEVACPAGNNSFAVDVEVRQSGGLSHYTVQSISRN